MSTCTRIYIVQKWINGRVVKKGLCKEENDDNYLFDSELDLKKIEEGNDESNSGLETHFFGITLLFKLS